VDYDNDKDDDNGEHDVSDEGDGDGEGEGSDEDVAEEVESQTDVQDLSPEQQQVNIILKATKSLVLGTLMLVVFSSPLVDCLDEVGTRLVIY
jgi:hypothetical protein